MYQTQQIKLKLSFFLFQNKVNFKGFIYERDRWGFIYGQRFTILKFNRHIWTDAVSKQKNYVCVCVYVAFYLKQKTYINKWWNFTGKKTEFWENNGKIMRIGTLL